jgi:hypothetical protein
MKTTKAHDLVGCEGREPGPSLLAPSHISHHNKSQVTS